MNSDTRAKILEILHTYYGFKLGDGDEPSGWPEYGLAELTAIVIDAQIEVAKEVLKYRRRGNFGGGFPMEIIEPHDIEDMVIRLLAAKEGTAKGESKDE